MSDKREAQVNALKSLRNHMYSRMAKDDAEEKSMTPQEETKHESEEEPKLEAAEVESGDEEDPLEAIKHIFRPAKGDKKPGAVVAVMKKKSTSHLFQKKKK